MLQYIKELEAVVKELEEYVEELNQRVGIVEVLLDETANKILAGVKEIHARMDILDTKKGP